VGEGHSCGRHQGAMTVRKADDFQRVLGLGNGLPAGPRTLVSSTLLQL
jgi:hypothetical protein